MIGPRQLALLQCAREKLELSAESYGRVLEVAGAARPEDLTRAGFDLAMDQCTALDFRDRRRPVLSRQTQSDFATLFDGSGLTPFERATVLRNKGFVSDIRDLDGYGLLNLLSHLSAHVPDIEGFVARRRSVTPKQLALLHVANSAINLNRITHSRLLQSCGGVNSPSDLDQRGFDLVLAYMRHAGFEDNAVAMPDGPDLGERPGFASTAQIRLIRTLWAEWAGSADDVALTGWLERFHKVSSLRFLTTVTARKVITSLKAMKQKGGSKPKVVA